jgi:hypothetical protein
MGCARRRLPTGGCRAQLDPERSTEHEEAAVRLHQHPNRFSGGGISRAMSTPFVRDGLDDPPAPGEIDDRRQHAARRVDQCGC